MFDAPAIATRALIVLIWNTSILGYCAAIRSLQRSRCGLLALRTYRLET